MTALGFISRATLFKYSNLYFSRSVYGILNSYDWIDIPEKKKYIILLRDIKLLHISIVTLQATHFVEIVSSLDSKHRIHYIVYIRY